MRTDTSNTAQFQLPGSPRPRNASNPESFHTNSEEEHPIHATKPGKAKTLATCITQGISNLAQQLKDLLIHTTSNNYNAIEEDDTTNSLLFKTQPNSDLYTNISRCLSTFKQIVSNNEHIFFKAAYGICGYPVANMVNEKISDEEFGVIKQVCIEITCAVGAMIVPFMLYITYTKHTNSHIETKANLHLRSMISVGCKQTIISLAQKLVPETFSNLDKTLQTLLIGSGSGVTYYVAQNVVKIAAESLKNNRTDSLFTSFKNFVTALTGGLILSSTAGALPGIFSSVTQATVDGSFNYTERGAIEGVATTVADLANSLINSVMKHYGWLGY